MVQFMQALAPKNKKKIIYVFIQPDSVFEPADHDLIDVCLSDLTAHEINVILKKLDPIADSDIICKLMQQA